MSSRSLEVKIELGHKAVLKDKPTSEGYTHDWTVFVRGPEGCKIENFVEKVVFKLHESFPKSKRTLRVPPYQVSESGYAGFNMPIIVYFKTKEEPKRLQFIYDLYLSMDGKPLNNIRCEKLTFHNPPEEFCSKLFKGGATIKDTTAAAAAPAPVAAVSPAKKPPTPPQKKSPHLTGAAPASTQFSVLFGSPIIKGQEPKDGKKNKDKKDKKDKEYKRDKKEKSASAGGKDEKPKESIKPEKNEKPEKLTLTLNTNGKPGSGHSSEVKKEIVREKKRDNSSSPNQREKDDPKRKKKKSSSHKDSPDSKKPRLEDSTAASIPAANAVVPPAPTSGGVAKSKKKSQSKESLTTTSPPLANVNDANDVESTPSPPDHSRKSKSIKEVKSATTNDDLKPSLPPPKSQAPRRVASPADAKKKRPVSNSSALNAMMLEMDADGSSPESESEASRYKRLHALKVKIAKLPKEKMQLVVDIVEESGNFELSDESFDFDLHVADASTITRLQQLVS